MKTRIASFLNAKPVLIAELLLLMLALPVAILKLHLVRYMLPMLWGIALYCCLVHWLTGKPGFKASWGWHEMRWEALKLILLRLALAALFLGLATWVILPERLFSFVAERPAFWALVMLMYPILSVLPQEIIFRMYFFERYASLFPTRETVILASGLGFGFAHVIFENWVAPLLCVVGGLLFALTYQKRRSLALVSLEHALYGDLLFTVGLGYYFYHGSVAAVAQVAN